MGELLSFPGKRADSDEEEGIGRRPAPSGRASADARQEGSAAAVEPIRPRAEPPSGAAEGDDDGLRWAVPGVADEPLPEPSRATRRASNVAMAALARHDASEGEVRAKLVAKELDEAEVAAELERLRRAGLIDDHAFAVRQVERLRERKGLGDGAIRSALRMRLVPQDVVDAVLAEEVEDEDEAQDRLQHVADERARRLGSLPYPVAERRLTAYLMRKGYGGSTVRAAVRSALDSAGVR